MSSVTTVLAAVILFAAAVSAAFAVSYPGQIAAALDTLDAASPLGNPQLSISGIAVPDDALIADISEIGDGTPAVCYDTATADGRKLRLISVGSDALPLLLQLTDGTLPQSPTDCAVVALSPNTAPAIGAALRPCDENGEALLSDAGTPCTLTVVGIGENMQSVLSPITEPTVDYLVYTVSDDAWHTEDAQNCLFLTSCRTDDPISAVQALHRKHSGAQTAYLAAQAEAQRIALLAAVTEADNAITEQQITVQNLDNRLDTAKLRVTELENLMMDAVAALQAEQQQFVSDMEYNEYYALRQVDLIPRRDRAEEGYAKQEATIADIRTRLQTAYAERDTIMAEYTEAQTILTARQTEAEAAQAALEAWSGQPQIRAAAWDVTRAEQEPGYAALTAHAKARARDAWLLCGILTAVFFIGSITVYSVSRRTVLTPGRFTVFAALTAVPAVLFGGCVLTGTVFAHAYPALTESLPLTAFQPMTLVILPLTALIAALAAILGHRIRKNAAPKSASAS